MINDYEVLYRHDHSTKKKEKKCMLTFCERFCKLLLSSGSPGLLPDVHVHLRKLRKKTVKESK